MTYTPGTGLLIAFAILHTIGALVSFRAFCRYRFYIVSPKRRLWGWSAIVLMSLGWWIFGLVVAWDHRPRRDP